MLSFHQCRSLVVINCCSGNDNITIFDMTLAVMSNIVSRSGAHISHALVPSEYMRCWHWTRNFKRISDWMGALSGVNLSASMCTVSVVISSICVYWEPLRMRVIVLKWLLMEDYQVICEWRRLNYGTCLSCWFGDGVVGIQIACKAVFVFSILQKGNCEYLGGWTAKNKIHN